jgi:hypothetical protein
MTAFKVSSSRTLIASFLKPASLNAKMNILALTTTKTKKFYILPFCDSSNLSFSANHCA